jgi:uncharacterized RDD family membrane protein YckC
MATPSQAPYPGLNLGGYAGQPGQLNGAGFGVRLGARLIDLAAHYVVSIVFGFALGIIIAVTASIKHVPVDSAIAPLRAPTPIISYVLAILGSACYHFLCEGLHGSTIGKRMLGLVVLSEDGTPCGVQAAIVRTAGYFVDALFFGLIGYHAMKRSPLQQRYGDSWAHTMVAYRKDVPPDRLRSGGRFAGVVLLGLFVDVAMIAASILIRYFQ